MQQNRSTYFFLLFITLNFRITDKFRKKFCLYITISGRILSSHQEIRVIIIFTGVSYISNQVSDSPGLKLAKN